MSELAKKEKSSYSSKIQILYLNFIFHICKNLKAIDKRDGEFVCFRGASIPSISLEEFIKVILNSRIIDKENIDGVLVYSIIFLQRFRKCNIEFNLYTCHRIILTSILLGSKIYEDEYNYNVDWSACFGITLFNLNLMEIGFLTILDFDLFVSREQFLSIMRCLM